MIDMQKLPARPLTVTGFGLLFFALCLFGCAGLGQRLEPPRITLANIQLQKMAGLETVFQLQIRVFNTNDVDLEVKGIECDLEINGENFATGVSKAAVTIPAYGTEIVGVVLYSSVINIFKGIYGLQNAEEISCRLKGKLRASGGGYGPVALPFQSEGNIKLEDLTHP